MDRLTGILVALELLLSFLGYCTPRSPYVEPRKTSSAVSHHEGENGCHTPAQIIPADSIVRSWERLTYPRYLIQKKYLARPPMGLPPQSVESSFFVVEHTKRIIARFDAGIDSAMGNSSAAGWFPVLNNGEDQLIVSQEISRSGVQWVVDFSRGFNIIFDGQKFRVGREAGDMQFSDIDGNGLFEITVPITDFYGFEHWRLTTMDTPLPSVIFQYDPVAGQYLPANPYFKRCLLNDINKAEQDVRRNENASLGQLLSVVLDYEFVCEEERGWRFFEEVYKLPDKNRVRADIQKILNRHPVFRYFRRTTPVKK